MKLSLVIKSNGHENGQIYGSVLSLELVCMRKQLNGKFKVLRKTEKKHFTYPIKG